MKWWQSMLIGFTIPPILYMVTLGMVEAGVRIPWYVMLTCMCSTLVLIVVVFMLWISNALKRGWKVADALEGIER